MQSPQSVVPVGMTKSAVCVNVEEDYGVVEVHKGSSMDAPVANMFLI